MNILTMDVLKRDNSDVKACLRYILKRCCPYRKENDTLNVYKVYSNMDFMQLKWILDRCNFEAGKDYGLKFFDYEMLFVLEDTDLVPETFDCKWKSKEEDYISIADKIIMNRVIRRWKLYGKICVNISEWWWKRVKNI